MSIPTFASLDSILQMILGEYHDGLGHARAVPWNLQQVGSEGLHVHCTVWALLRRMDWADIRVVIAMCT